MQFVETAAKPMLMPPPDGHCRICARKHGPDMPHDAESLFYGMRFRLRYDRDGTWADAIAHCPQDIQEFWKRGLRRRNAWSQPPAGIEPIAEPIDS